MNTLSSILHSAVTIMTPLLFASLGGLFSELSGLLNIALEGLMLTGAFVSVIASHATGSLFLGTLIGAAAAAVLAAIHALTTLKLKANVFITGLAVNLLASGGTLAAAYRIFGNRGVVRFENLHGLTEINIPLIERIPVIGAILSGHSAFVYLSWVAVALLSVLLYRTVFGYRLRAAGYSPRTLTSLGMNPERYQAYALILSGVFAGIGGAMLTLNLGSWVPSISSGRGWIALVIIYLGAKKPSGLLVAAFVFGLAESLSNYLQGVLGVPADFILAIPYVFCLAVLVASSAAGSKNRVIKK